LEKQETVATSNGGNSTSQHFVPIVLSLEETKDMWLALLRTEEIDRLLW